MLPRRGVGSRDNEGRYGELGQRQEPMGCAERQTELVSCLLTSGGGSKKKPEVRMGVSRCNAKSERNATPKGGELPDRWLARGKRAAEHQTELN